MSRRAAAEEHVHQLRAARAGHARNAQDLAPAQDEGDVLHPLSADVAGLEDDIPDGNLFPLVERGRIAAHHVLDETASWSGPSKSYMLTLRPSRSTVMRSPILKTSSRWWEM